MLPDDLFGTENGGFEVKGRKEDNWNKRTNDPNPRDVLWKIPTLGHNGISRYDE